MHAYQVMTKPAPGIVPSLGVQNLVTVAPEAELEEVARVMLEHRTHQVFVVELGVIEGVITAFDLLRTFTEPHDTEHTGYRR